MESVASTAVLLRNVLHSKTNGAGTNSATYNRTSQRIARKELRADQIDSEAALSLTGEWERLLPVQINLWPDFQRIPRRAP
jgi:hypothetical protein